MKNLNIFLFAFVLFITQVSASYAQGVVTFSGKNGERKVSLGGTYWETKDKKGTLVFSNTDNTIVDNLTKVVYVVKGKEVDEQAAPGHKFTMGEAGDTYYLAGDAGKTVYYKRK